MHKSKIATKYVMIKWKRNRLVWYPNLFKDKPLNICISDMLRISTHDANMNPRYLLLKMLIISFAMYLLSLILFDN